MNKSAFIAINKVVLLILAILALVVILMIVKNSLNSSIDVFFSFIKEIFK